ncbi:MAG: response regulator [Acidobacteriota bacterium]
MVRILIVDDEPSVREILCMFLQDHGYEAEAVEDGTKALERIPSLHPQVVFLDVAMPGINGLRTLEKIRELDPECAVVMMSGHANHQAALHAMDMGAHDFVQKPFDFSYLENMLLAKIVTFGAGRRPAEQPPGR